jgi:hypothetical protein
VIAKLTGILVSASLASPLLASLSAARAHYGFMSDDTNSSLPVQGCARKLGMDAHGLLVLTEDGWNVDLLCLDSRDPLGEQCRMT